MFDVANPGPLSEEVAREEIARIETRIESLNESIERCRKISLFGRLVIGAGVLWIVLMLMRLLSFEPFNLVGAIASMLGGIVLFGSNASTWKQMLAARNAAVARRTELIDAIAMRVVAPTADTEPGSDYPAFWRGLRGSPTIH